MALYVPAGTAATVHVKIVLLEVLPGNGPVGEVQVVADPEGPVSAQVVEPVGALAPERPVIVAV